MHANRSRMGWTRALALLLPLPWLPAADGPLRVTCTTTHLSCVVRTIGRDHVDVTAIVPFGMCPGHFDLAPREAEALGRADLILAHGFERFLEDVRAGHPTIAVTTVPVPGNWMVPEIHRAGAKAVADLLCASRPGLEDTFRAHLDAYLHDLDALLRQQAPEQARRQGRRVLCSVMNRDLVEALGLDVLAAFPRDEDLSARGLADIVLPARRAGIAMVIDNRQSSGKVGRTLATELGVPLVLLTNFPPDAPGRQGYLAALERNYSALLGVPGQPAATP